MTVINLNPLDQPGVAVKPNTDAQRRAARAVIARHATGPDDQAYLLRTLGMEGA